MKSSHLVALICLSILTASASYGQSTPRRIPGGGFSSNTTKEVPVLSANYRIAVKATKGEGDAKEGIGKVSTLTCSSKIELEGQMDGSLAPSTLTMTGTLEELEDGKLMLHYQLSLTIAQASTPTNNRGPAIVRNIQYRSFSNTGSVRIKPGKSYELLRSGEAQYSISVTPESEDANE